LQHSLVQNPFKIGYLGVRTMINHLLGRPVEKRVDTGVMIIAPENLDSAEVKN